jgi:hypothetical protein
MDGLSDLQLRVARRADELAQELENGTSLNLYCWLLAETEVLGGDLLDRAVEVSAPVESPSSRREGV